MRAAAACFLLLIPSLALAEVPLPLQPGCGDSEDLSPCPPDAGDWSLWNFTPAEFEGVIDPAEIPLGVGNGVLPAWQISTGRWDQVVAVGDSGVLWDSGQIKRKVFLNIDELPVPQNSDGDDYPDHDADGNGLVNIDDYEDDPRVDITAGAWRSDHMLDASDIIATFSDGVDDDGNGYVDDIAGWDFFENDNDPFATNASNYGDHGTGVLEDAGAEGGNGGRIGVCPNCAVLPIRVGDSFVTTGPHIAQAILFATEHGAASIAMALGGMTDSEFVQAAVDYAAERGTLVVAAAGDETSFHRNWPAALPGVLNVHSIAPSNRDDIGSARSFLRFVNCNNFGGRVDLVAGAGNGCATAAVGRIAGAVGLLQSAAVDLHGERLDVVQLTNLLNSTATDIDIPGSRGPDADDDLFPSYPGWDAFFGWGRIHVGRAMDAIVELSLPPRAEITSPAWYSHHRQADYTRGPTGSGPLVDTDGLEVRGSIAGDGVTWRLEAGVGTDIDSGWWEVASGEGAVDGTLGFVDVAQRWAESVPPIPATGCGATVDEEERGFLWVLEGDALEERGYDASYRPPPLRPADTITTRYDALDPSHLTLRLTVIDAAGRTSEARRQIFVRRDERMLPGFPKDLGASLEPSVALVDLDGDDVFEIVQAATNGEVHVFDGSGAELPGWPQQTGLYTTTDPENPDHQRDIAAYDELDPDSVRQVIVGSPAVGDLDGDGALEIVITTLSGGVYVWQVDGSLRPGFPVFMDYGRCDPANRNDDVRTDCGIFGTPALADLDADGGLDIIVGAMDQHLYAWDADGALLTGFPTFVQAGPDLPDVQEQIARIVSSPAVGDLDGDGDLEVVLGTGQTAGSDIAGYGLLYALDHEGNLLDGFPIAIFAGFAGALPYIGEGVVVSPSLADLDGNGDLEIVANAIADPGSVYNHDGTEYAGFAPTIQSYGPGTNANEPSALMMTANSSIGDLDGDGALDVFVGGSGIGYGLNIVAWVRRFEHQHLLMGYRGLGQPADLLPFSGFPRVVEDIQFFGSPALADVTGDGVFEVLNGTAYVTRAFAEDGTEPAGPYFTGGWQMAAPAVGDVDGDGMLDLVASTREGWLFAWRTDGPADGTIAWPQFRHNARRTGNVHDALPTQAGPPPPTIPPPDPDDGCATIAPGPAGGWLLVLVALGRRRRA